MAMDSADVTRFGIDASAFQPMLPYRMGCDVSTSRMLREHAKRHPRAMGATAVPAFISRLAIHRKVALIETSA
jgi:hypothetical protein